MLVHHLFGDTSVLHRYSWSPEDMGLIGHNDFGDHLTRHLTPSFGQMLNVSNNLAFD